MPRLQRNVCMTLYSPEAVPTPPEKRRLCPTCLNPMPVSYCWKSSETVVHYFCICQCGTRAKARLLHFRLDKKGRLVE